MQLEWISAAEGQKFALVMREVEKMRKQVTPEEIEFTKQALAPKKKEEPKEKKEAAKVG